MHYTSSTSSILKHNISSKEQQTTTLDKPRIAPETKHNMTNIINLVAIKDAVDLNEWAKREDNTYIGRYNPLLPDANCEWGNPFRPENGMEACLENYKHHVLSSKNLMDKLKDLKENLGCWCAPNRCHGEVLIILRNSFLKKQTLHNELWEYIITKGQNQEMLSDEDDEEEIDITILSTGSEKEQAEQNELDSNCSQPAAYNFQNP